MSAQQNIQIIREYLASRGREHVPEDVILHDYSRPEPVKGRQAVEQLLDAFYVAAFSDTHVEVRHITADENSVVLEVTFHGVNSGSLFGHAPTGKRVELAVCGVYDIEGGFIRRMRFYFDTCMLKRQLGWQEP